MHGLKYIANYKNVDGRVRSIQLKELGYEGDASYMWDTNLDGPTFIYGNTDVLFGDTAVASQVKLEFLFQQHYELTAFVENTRSYLCEITEGDRIDGAVVWSGWIEPTDTKHGYKNPSYFVTMTASCGLNRLAKNKFFITDTNINELTQWEVIQRCLSLIGIDRNIRVGVYTARNASPSAPNPMTSVTVDIYRYYVSSEWMSAAEILKDILVKYTAKIFQHNNMWVIRGDVDNALDHNSYIEYTVGGGQSAVTPWPDLTLDVNGESSQLTLDGAVISVQGAVRKYIANVDLGGPKERLQNGSLQLWGPDGLLGWIFNMGPQGIGGWKKVSTGIENSPYALNIKGKAPQPYTSTKKVKGWWIFKKKVSVYKEPTTWIETPPIEIKRTDTTLTVSFEYYTESDSAGFLYSVRVHTDEANGRYPENLWYKPGSYNTIITNEFTHHIAPPHPLIDPVTGARQSRGKVEIVFQTKDFNNNPWVSGPGSAFYSYAAVRFYMSIDDGHPGDEYTIYGLNGGDDAKANDTAGDGDGIYKVSLEYKAEENDVADEVNLITGDYSTEYVGTTLLPNDLTVSTGSWRRRENSESMSIYRAMLMDRLCMTWQPLDMIEGDIKSRPGAPDISFLHKLVFKDRNDNEFRIVRYSYEEYRRIATVTCVQIKYNQPPISDIIQKTFTEGRGLIDSGTTDGGDSDGGDGIYPEKELPTGRIGVDEDFLPADQDLEEELGRSRVGILFTDITPLEYVVAIESEDSVDLTDYFSALYLEGQEEDIDPEFKHDPASFELVLVDKPTWIKEIEIDGLVITATAIAPKTGTYYLYFDVIDHELGITIQEKVPILVTESEDFIEEWPPVFLNIPPLYFLVGETEEKHLLLTDYLDPDGLHDGTGLSPKLLTKPSWVSTSKIVFMDLSVIGTPLIAGSDYVTYEISDALGRSITVPFEVIAIDPPKVKYTLIETGLPDPLILGAIPGYFELPTKFDVRAQISGSHNKYQIKVNAGSDPDANILVDDTQEIEPTDLATYRAFQIEDGTPGVVGLYRVEFAAWIDTIEIYREVVYFTLYDEEFLAKLFFELWNTTKIGDIAITGVTKFKNPGSFNPKAIVDLTHTKAVLTLSYEGEIIKVTEFVTPDTEYDVYTTPPADQPAGLYRINAKFYSGSSLIYERQSDFEILAKPPVAESGLILVEMIPGTADYKVIQEIPLKGLTADLPTNGYNVLCTSFGAAFDWVGIEVFNKVSNQFVEINVPQYTKKPNFVVYLSAVSEAEILAFDILSSLEIGDIHQVPSTLRFRFTAKLGGESGVTIGIKQADISFRAPLAPGDYSGLRFLYLDSVNELVDANMPKTGAKYILPELPKHWTVSFRKLPGNVLFDGFITRLKKNGVVLHATGPDYIEDVTLLLPVSELNSDVIARIWGYGPGIRTLDNPSSAAVSIDEPGIYIAEFTLLLNGDEVGVLDTEFELILDEDVPEVEEADCCEASSSFTQIIGDGITTVFNIAHMLDTFDLHVTFRKTSNRQEVFVENEATTTNNVVVTFYTPPAAGSRVVIIEKA